MDFCWRLATSHCCVVKSGSVVEFAARRVVAEVLERYWRVFRLVERVRDTE